MICDDCKHRDKCTKIISEGKKYCRDKMIEDTLFRVDKGCPKAFYLRYDKCTKWSPKDFFKEHGVTWR